MRVEAEGVGQLREEDDFFAREFAAHHAGGKVGFGCGGGVAACQGGQFGGGGGVAGFGQQPLALFAAAAFLFDQAAFGFVYAAVGRGGGNHGFEDEAAAVFALRALRREGVLRGRGFGVAALLPALVGVVGQCADGGGRAGFQQVFVGFFTQQHGGEADCGRAAADFAEQVFVAGGFLYAVEYLVEQVLEVHGAVLSVGWEAI